jgi:hypothetical protein
MLSFPSQSWQLAWARPIEILNASSLPDGVWRTFDIPALALSADNHVQLMPTWLNKPGPTYFFSYRQAIGWDKNIMSAYTNGCVLPQ